MKPYFTHMARYNAWANLRLYGAARALPEALYRRNVGAFFGSLHGTLNHLLVTDRIWMGRFTGRTDQPQKPDAILHEDLLSLEAARREEDDRIIQYVAGLSEDGMDADLRYSTTAGVAKHDPLGELLAHLFNHQTHHRGQAHAILTVLGVSEPPSLDLLAMMRESQVR